MEAKSKDEQFTALQALWKRLGKPGLDKTWTAARRSKMSKLTKSDVKYLISQAGEGTKGIFRPIQPSLGKSAASGPFERCQADLLDYKNSPVKLSGGSSYTVVLAVIDVFTRQLWTKALTSKSPHVVAIGVRELLESMPQRVKVLSTDDGQEWGEPVQEVLKELDVAWNPHVGKRDINAISVLDKAIQSLKQRIARLISEEGSDDNWYTVLSEATDAHNSLTSDPLHAAPERVAKNPVVRFLNEQDNARKFDHNKRLASTREANAEREGAFRRPLDQPQKFGRSFHQKYASDVEKISKKEGSQLFGDTGKPPVDIKHVSLVPVTQKSATAPISLDERKLEKRRTATQPIVDAMVQMLEGRSKIALTTVGKRLIETLPSYKEIMKEVHIGLGSLARVVEIWPETLQFAGSDKYVKLS